MSEEAKVDLFSGAVDHLRATTKWTLAAFAAVGGLLIAGVQLASIGRLSNDRLAVAAIATVVGLLAVAYAIRAVLKVETSGYTTLDTLTDADRALLNGNKALLAGYTSVEDLRQAYYDIIDEQFQAIKEGNGEEIASLSKWISYYAKIVNNVLSVVRYHRVLAEFRRVITPLVISSFVAAVALVVFAWVANPPTAPAATSKFQIPVEASVQLTEEGLQTLAESLGETCVQSPVRVIVLSETDGRFDVVSIPTSACETRRFTINTGVNGELLPITPVDIGQE